MNFIYVLTLLLLALVGTPTTVMGNEQLLKNVDPALQKLVEDAVNVNFVDVEKNLGPDGMQKIKDMAAEHAFYQTRMDPYGSSNPAGRNQLGFISDITDSFVDAGAQLVADIVTAIICEFDIDAVLEEIGANLTLPDLDVTLGFDTFKITVNIDTVDAGDNFDGFVGLKGDGPQVFDVVVKNEQDITAIIAATVGDADLDVTADISGNINAVLDVTAGRLPMNIDLQAYDLPLELRVDGDVLPFNADLKADEFVMNLKVKSFSLSLAPLVMAALLFIFFVFLTMLVVRVQYVLLSMKSMLDTLVDQSGDQRLRFCHKCGKRNGHDAKYCHGFFCGAKLVDMVDEEDLSENGDLKDFNPGH